MTAVGVREFKAKASEYLRRVEEDQQPIEITRRGKVVARLQPVEPPRPSREELEAWWADHDRLAEEIAKHWPEGVSAAEAISEQRREL